MTETLDSYEKGLLIVNTITIALNKIEDETPESKEYIQGIRDILSQVLKVMDRTNRVTERQMMTLKNILSALTKTHYN